LHSVRLTYRIATKDTFSTKIQSLSTYPYHSQLYPAINALSISNKSFALIIRVSLFKQKQNLNFTTMYDLYVSGGVMYMHPITLVFIINLIVIGYVAINRLQHKAINLKYTEAVKQLGTLGLVLGALGTMIGFFQMFGALGEMKETLPLNVISGGVNAAIINLLYGLIIFCISLLTYIIFKLTDKEKV
jgi:hypothetical protein